MKKQNNETKARDASAVNAMVSATKVISAFCGTGKTYLCNNSSKNLIEKECWKFDKAGFPANYVKAITENIGKVDAVFMTTNKIALDALINDDIDITLVYPKRSLKDEYMGRYHQRGSHDDFIETIDKHWDDWIKELEARDDCKKHIIGRGEYITDALPWLH